MIEILDLGIKLNFDWEKINTSSDLPYVYEGFCNQYMKLYIMLYGLSIGDCNDEFIYSKLNEYQDKNIISSEIVDKIFKETKFKCLYVLMKNKGKDCFVYKLFTTFYGKANYFGSIDIYFNDLSDLDAVKAIFDRIELRV